MTRFLFGLFIALPLLGFSQHNFQKGYLVTNKKDTLSGWIDYKERTYSPISLVFSADGRSATKTYTLKDCEEFNVQGITSFKRFLVNVSLGSNELADLTEKIDKRFRTDTVFLEVLQSGQHVTLYVYTDRIKKRFYIQDKTDSIPVELFRELYHAVDDPAKEIVNIKYARQLLDLYRKYDKWSEGNERALGVLKYNDSEMIKAVSVINDQKLERSKFSKTRWFAGASLDLARSRFFGDHELASANAKIKRVASPMISGGIDVFVNPAIRRTVFRTELSLVKSNSEVSTGGGYNAFDMVTATLSSGVLYHLYNTDNFKVYLSGAAGFNFSNYSNLVAYKFLNGTEHKVDRTLEFKKLNITFPVNLGVVLNKKIELLAGYNFPTSLTDYPWIRVYRQRFRFGMNYLFGKH